MVFSFLVGGFLINLGFRYGNNAPQQVPKALDCLWSAERRWLLTLHGLDLPLPWRLVLLC